MQKNTLKLVMISICIVILGAACSIPYIYESPSLFYKTGLDKFLLRMGKIAGIIAAVMICFQVVYIFRPVWLENTLSPIQLLKYHRRSGLVILVLGFVHPPLILGADHFVFFPAELKYWPEFTGIGLLAALSAFILVSWWQRKSGISYKTWRLLHRIFAPVIILGMAVHILNVSRSFESGPPLWGFIAMLAMTAFLLTIKYIRN